MSRAYPVVILQNIDDIVKSTNNGEITARLVWVDPALSRDNTIRCTLSDATRSIRLAMWGYDTDVKAFLLENMMQIFCWTGMTVRIHKDSTYQREHKYGLSMNQNDEKYKLGFVGRFQIVDSCTLPFMDIVMPRPELMSETPLPIPARSMSMTPSTSMTEPKRERDDETPGWICPVSGCRLPDYEFCMMTGKPHPKVCEKCGTQGKFLYCPAAPRGTKELHEDMVLTSKIRHAEVVQELLETIDDTQSAKTAQSTPTAAVGMARDDNTTAAKAVTGPPPPPPPTLPAPPASIKSTVEVHKTPPQPPQQHKRQSF